MLEYKIDVMQELKDAGYNTYRLRRENILSQATITQLNQKKMVGIIVIDRLCELLDLQPGNIIRYVPNKKGEK